MKYDKNHALLECAIPGLPQKSGKVRDVFDLGDKLLMVVTDRISAFDVILPCGVPDKGKVLNQLSLFWMEFFGMKNHLVTANVDEYPAELQPYKEDLRGRSMLVKKVKMVEVECIARGYLTGSGWKEYQKSGTVNGMKLRAGYENASKLDEVLFTPTTKAAIGDHDEAINFDETVKLVGEKTATLLRDTTVALYSKAADYARAVRDLEALTGKLYTSINIVGGGSNNQYLNQATANACGLPVFAGPTEGTALGNLMVQFIQAGEYADLAAARAAIKQSFEIKEVLPSC